MDVKTAYEQWLHDFAADADTIADLKAIANDPAEIEDRFYTELSFGTAGMRGVLGAGMNRMNRYNVRRATKGLAKYLLQNPQEAQRFLPLWSIAGLSGMIFSGREVISPL